MRCDAMRPHLLFESRVCPKELDVDVVVAVVVVVVEVVAAAAWREGERERERFKQSEREHLFNEPHAGCAPAIINIAAAAAAKFNSTS